jgi:hypothetical protein
MTVHALDRAATVCVPKYTKYHETKIKAGFGVLARGTMNSCLLGHNSMQSDEYQQTFRKNISATSSGSYSKQETSMKQSENLG